MIGKDEENLPRDLENMSIPELEVLLQQDFLASDGSSPDVDYIMTVVEVIQKKEQAQLDYQPLDTEQAWEEFKSFYMTKAENSIYRSDEETDEEAFCSETIKPAAGHKKSKMIRRCLLTAASLCLLFTLTCIPVLGYNSLFQMLASWTAEQFGFYMPAERCPDSEQIPQEFAELQEIMQELDAELTIPRFPEGFEPSDTMLSYLPNNSTLKFSIMYQRGEEYYIFDVNWNDNNIINRYEKDENLVETCTYSNIKHYILSNTNNNAVAWYVGKTEHYVISNGTISDLKELLEFTYEVK